MSEKRIAKGWTHFGSNNLDIHNAKSRAERVKADKTANNLIRNVKPLSVEDLVKEKREAEAEAAGGQAVDDRRAAPRPQKAESRPQPVVIAN